MVSSMITDHSDDFLNDPANAALLAEIAADLQKFDPDRYFVAMMAAPTDRAALMVVFAFNLDLARIPEKVSEAVLGQMRYQSWRDAFARARDGGSPGIPLAGLLNGLALPSDQIDSLIDAREELMLIEQPSRTLESIRAHAAKLGGTLGELTLEALSKSAPTLPEPWIAAARSAGQAYTTIGLARAARSDHLPNDMEMKQSIKALCDAALDDIAACRASLAATPRPTPQLFPAFAVATIADQQAASLRRFDYDPKDARTRYRRAGDVIALAWRRWRNRP